MAEPWNRLYDPRATAPEPENTCPECGGEIPYCAFACSRHIANEAEYRDAENGFACFVCGWPKPDHSRSCYRGAGVEPTYKKASWDFDDWQNDMRH